MTNITSPSTHAVPPESEFARYPRSREHTRAAAAGAGGIGEALAAAAVVVLSILALAGIFPGLFLAIACIAAGVAFLLEGGSVAARVSRLLTARATTDIDTTEFEGGIAAEALAGAAGIVLGILSLIGIAPLVLPIVAVLIFGAGMLFGSGLRSKLNSMISSRRTIIAGEEPSGPLQEMVFVSAGGEGLVGAAVIVLAILALLGNAPVTLTLVALLAIGGSLMLSGTAIGGKMLSIARP